VSVKIPKHFGRRGMSSTTTAIAIVGSIVLTSTFAVVVAIVRRRMDISRRSGVVHLQTESDLLRAPPLVSYVIGSSEGQGLFQKDIDLVCKEYTYEGVIKNDHQEWKTFQSSEGQASEVKTKEESDVKAASCSICLEDLELGALVRTLPCNHTFHSSEICRWLCKRAICPCCRASFEYLVFFPNREDPLEY